VPPLVPARRRARGPPRACSRARRVAARERFALVGPRSAFGPAREWFAERFVAAGRELATRGLRVLVCGTRRRRDACAAVAAGIGGAAASIAGETTLPALVAVGRAARLALCNDSGSRTSPPRPGADDPDLRLGGERLDAAAGPHVRVLHRAPVCSPCWRRRCVIGTRCLDAVRVPWVMRHADALLAEAG
jgi:hypothetical protein